MKEDAVDTVHYLDGVDEDDENEEGVVTKKVVNLRKPSTNLSTTWILHLSLNQTFFFPNVRSQIEGPQKSMLVASPEEFGSHEKSTPT